MKKSRKLLVSLELILFTSLTLVISFAWIPRKWAPEVTYDDIHISTSGALIISFTGKDGTETNFTDVVVNDYLNVNQFELRQVSSSDGLNFVEPDFSPMVNNDNILNEMDKKVPLYKPYDLIKGKRIIETKFKIKSTVDTSGAVKKAVFFDPLTGLTLNSLGTPESGSQSNLAIRVAIIPTSTKVATIFSNNKTVDSGNLYAATDTAAGNNIYNTYPDYLSNTLNPDCHKEQGVINFEDKTSTADPLFIFDKSGEEEITVRIWLEGCDPNCVNKIVGDQLNLLLKFDTAEVV